MITVRKSKTLFCNTESHVSTRVKCQYNPRTDHTGIYTDFKKTCDGTSEINRSCALYLGVHVAERVLSKVYKDVIKMRNGNPGYDFVCNKGHKIDVKSACARKDRNAWIFNIKKNRIADYFLCLAFDDRESLNPERIWLIPSNKVKHLTGFQVTRSRVDKFQEYELTDKIEQVISCCNALRGDWDGHRN